MVGVDMRIIGALLGLLLSLGMAHAQPSAPVPKSADGKATPSRVSKQATDDGVQDCMRLWDAKTHMSRVEWVRTCKRVQNRLENLKVDSLDMTGMGARTKAGKQGSAGAAGRVN